MHFQRVRHHSALPQSLRSLVLALAPERYHLPLRYHYRRCFHRLEPEFRFRKSLVGTAQTPIDVAGSLCVDIRVFLSKAQIFVPSLNSCPSSTNDCKTSIRPVTSIIFCFLPLRRENRIDPNQ